MTAIHVRVRNFIRDMIKSENPFERAVGLIMFRQTFPIRNEREFRLRIERITNGLRDALNTFDQKVAGIVESENQAA